MSDVEDLMRRQLSYYRAGAEQYDDANRSLIAADDADGRSRRVGHGRALRALEVVRGRRVLELAGGTGLYTEPIARLAASVTVVDGSPESIDLNSRWTRHLGNVSHVVADIFAWEPPERYGIVVFAFWLSHVPDQLFTPFWDLVDRCLTDDGVVVVIDARAPASETDDVAIKQGFFSEDRPNDGTSVRTLADGSKHTIVRILWEPKQLTDHLACLGWEARFCPDSDWLIGHVTKSAGADAASDKRLP